MNENLSKIQKMRAAESEEGKFLATKIEALVENNTDPVTPTRELAQRIESTVRSIPRTWRPIGKWYYIHKYDSEASCAIFILVDLQPLENREFTSFTVYSSHPIENKIVFKAVFVQLTPDDAPFRNPIEIGALAGQIDAIVSSMSTSWPTEKRWHDEMLFQSADRTIVTLCIAVDLTRWCNSKYHSFDIIAHPLENDELTFSITFKP